MDKLFEYETDNFGVSKKSIHLLRNKFNYETIDYQQVDFLMIKKGKDIKNWFWVFLVGLALLTFVGLESIRIYNLFFDNQTFIIYIERLLIPLFPLLLGIYSVIISLRNTYVMVVKVKTKSYHFSLRRIIKTDNFISFKDYIQDVFPNAVFRE